MKLCINSSVPSSYSLIFTIIKLCFLLCSGCRKRKVFHAGSQASWRLLNARWEHLTLTATHRVRFQQPMLHTAPWNPVVPLKYRKVPLIRPLSMFCLWSDFGVYNKIPCWTDACPAVHNTCQCRMRKCAQSSTSSPIFHIVVHCTALDSLDLIPAPCRHSMVEGINGTSLYGTRRAFRSPRPANTGLRNGARRKLGWRDWIWLSSTLAVESFETLRIWDCGKFYGVRGVYWFFESAWYGDTRIEDEQHGCLKLSFSLCLVGNFDDAIEHLVSALGVTANPTQVLGALSHSLPAPIFQALIQRLPASYLSGAGGGMGGMGGPGGMGGMGGMPGASAGGADDFDDPGID